ncbi:MAG: hypothetical protein JSU67_04485 [Gammaproteobacteria bacterium]|nr:MAG: hypothetical protein EP300_09300 [Gammaproteobacteria bacterium]UCH40952.1 MAG: hypothetical protein JSU67_04485 [Gammaproteobacteria bacterium]
MKNRDLIVFHGLPLLMVLFPFIWFAIVGNDRMLKGEAGIIENLTVVFLVVAIGYCISSISLSNRLGLPGLLRAWLFILILGSAYFALEEISYGQHMFGWGTSESWKELNDQDETNLHNVHAIFDQVPRALLTLAILVGGVVLPLYRHFRGIELSQDSRFYWQWPTMDCVTIGLLVILIRPALSVVDFEFINTGETKENLFALFIMLYCVSIQFRLKHRLAPGDETAQA